MKVGDTVDLVPVKKPAPFSNQPVFLSISKIFDLLPYPPYHAALCYVARPDPTMFFYERPGSFPFANCEPCFITLRLQLE